MIKMRQNIGETTVRSPQRGVSCLRRNPTPWSHFGQSFWRERADSYLIKALQRSSSCFWPCSSARSIRQRSTERQLFSLLLHISKSRSRGKCSYWKKTNGGKRNSCEALPICWGLLRIRQCAHYSQTRYWSVWGLRPEYRTWSIQSGCLRTRRYSPLLLRELWKIAGYLQPGSPDLFWLCKALWKEGRGSCTPEMLSRGIGCM